MSQQLITMTNSSIINPTVKYSLASTTFNDTKIKSLHKSIHPTIISDMGYSSKWPKALRCGTNYHYSLKLQHCGLEQLIQKADIIHRFIHNSDYKYLVTNMIKIFQLTSGISTPVLEYTKWNTIYVNSIWTSSMIRELQQYKY